MTVMTNAFQVTCQWVRHASFVAMRRARTGWLYGSTILAVALSAVHAANAQSITWTTLDYPGADGSELSGVDGSNVVGTFSSGFAYSGFRYDGVTFTPLNFPGDDATAATDIDGANIVGYYDDGNHGFLFNGATYTTLDFPGADIIDVRGISGSNIVGQYVQTGMGIQSFLFNGATWTPLQHPDIVAGVGETRAYKIDGDDIVGEYSSAALGTHGFLYDGATWTTLDYPGAVKTSAYGIDGVNIVGVYEPASGLRGGFLYDGTIWTPLNYPGAQETFVYGISGDRIVGLFIDDAGFHGFIATISKAAGDFDLDGDVDGHDFLLWQRGGSPAPLSAGDLANWRANYGGGSVVANSITVPEPTTLTLLMLAAAVRFAIRRRAREVPSTHQSVALPIIDHFGNGAALGCS